MRYRRLLALALTALIVAPRLLHAAGGFALNAKRLGSKTSYKTVICPYHPGKLESMTIQIAVKNLATTNTAIKVQWYFLAEKLDTGKLVIFRQGEKKFDLKAAGTANETVESEALVTYPPEHPRPTTDAKLVGYLVVATDSEGNVHCDASRPSLKALPKSPRDFDALKKDTKAWADEGGGR